MSVRWSWGPIEVYAYHDYGKGEGPLYAGLKAGEFGFEVCKT